MRRDKSRWPDILWVLSCVGVWVATLAFVAAGGAGTMRILAAVFLLAALLVFMALAKRYKRDGVVDNELNILGALVILLVGCTIVATVFGMQGP